MKPIHARNLAVISLALALAVSACSKTAQSTGGSPGSSAADGFEGTLTTSGHYAATWTASQEAQPDVFNSSNSVTLTSDHQTFANIKVKPDGSVSFGSAAPDLAANGAYTGTGANVTLDKTGALVCAFSVETDLVGSADGAILHIKGAMTVRWHPEGVGDLNCP